jgi:hypothetical protein
MITGEELAQRLDLASREVESLCGDNWHLVEDHVIGTVVEFAANGRHTFVHRIQSPDSAFEAKGYARILPACMAFDARRDREPDTDRSASVWTICDRCGDHHSSSTGRRLLVPAGSAAVEFVVCHGCVEMLDRDFGPVVWR